MTEFADKEREDRREALVYDIASYLKEPRAGGWKSVRERYPEIGERTFWRLVDKCKKGVSPEEILAGSIKKAKMRAQETSALAGEIISPAPAAPAAPITFAPVDGVRPIKKRDFLSRLAELISDTEKLREFSMKDGEIKNPMFFTRSVELRERLIMTELQANRDLFNFERVQQAIKAVVDEVSRENPALGKRIIERFIAVRAEFVSAGQVVE